MIVDSVRIQLTNTQHIAQVTTANNQQLIPIARNISFRQCPQTSHFVSSAIDPYISVDLNHEQASESALEAIKRKARGAVERRESAAKNSYYGQIFNEAVPTSTDERKLVVLLSWLEARERDIEKYRQFYLSRGFDVLNVKTSPWDLLLPNVGARKISEDFVRFMIDKHYSNVLLHGFSVGGYMFGRLLLELDKHESAIKDKMLNSVKGIVFDSLVPFEGTCFGVANSITQNPIAAKIIEQILRFYLFVGHGIATKHYLEVSDKVWGGPLRCPSLFLMSKDDKISDHRVVGHLADVWQGLGIETHKMLVDHSPHVQLFRKHNQAYTENVDKFLKHVKLN